MLYHKLCLPCTYQNESSKPGTCKHPSPSFKRSQRKIMISELIAFILVFYLPLTSPPPKTTVSHSPTPPTCHTSPPYSLLLQTPIFGWLLCGNSSYGGCLIPQCISCSFILVAQFNAPNDGITIPPHLLPVAPPLHTPHCCGCLFLVGCCVEIHWYVAV
jgi:hypothetical protein